MRKTLRPMVAAIVGIATAATLFGAVPASAGVLTDPPNTPPKSDVVGVGSDTTQDVMGLVGPTLAKSGFSANYNATNPRNKLWGYDAFGSPSSITPSQGCDEIVRPSGSSAGIAALKADQAAGNNCIDYARSSRVKNPATDGDLVFVPFARDGVTWATYPKTAGGTRFNAPKDLTTAQLTSIFNCSVTNWNEVGGKNAPIEPYLPQSGSGTRSFWLAAIGVPTPGPCVNQPAAFPENDGSATPVEDRPNAILPYSIAKYVAQTNGLGDDVRAGSVLRNINGTKPIVRDRLNADFSPAFLRNVFNVLKPEDLGKKAISKVFATDGYICNHAKITQTFGFGKLTGASCGYTPPAP